MRIRSGLDHVEAILKQESGIALLGDVERLHIMDINQVRQVAIHRAHSATNSEKGKETMGSSALSDRWQDGFSGSPLHTGCRSHRPGT